MLTIVLRSYATALAFLLIVAGAAVPAAAQRLGPEFQVNTFTTGRQYRPDVASGLAGEFVVVWGSYGQDQEPGFGIFGQRYDGSGDPVGDEFQINTYSTSSQLHPAAAIAASGDLLVAWAGAGVGGDGVHARAYDDAGVPVGGEFRVNEATTGLHFSPAVARADDGFVVVWESYAHDGEGTGNRIYARRFTSAGASVGGDLPVDGGASIENHTPAVDRVPAGGFVTVWERYVDPSSLTDVYARRFGADGTPLGGEFRVNSLTTGYQGLPSVAVNAGGDFIVVWESSADTQPAAAIFSRRFAANGTPLAVERPVNAPGSLAQTYPDVAAEPSGGAFVVWDSFADDDFSLGVYAVRLSSGGVPAAGAFQVHSYVPFHQGEPAVAVGDDGRPVVVWSSNLQDESDYGVFGQRYERVIFADGFESGSTGEWSDSSPGLRATSAPAPGCRAGRRGRARRAAKAAKAARRARRSVGVLLLQDRMAVVDGVEALRELERVAGDERELERCGGLLDRLLDPRRGRGRGPRGRRSSLGSEGATSPAASSDGRRRGAGRGELALDVPRRAPASTGGRGRTRPRSRAPRRSRRR